MRLLIRDEEFSLLHAERLMWGGFKLSCLGVSETVAGKEYQFISELESPTVLKPENTRLVQDESPHYRDSLLYLETQLRSRMSTGDEVSFGDRAAMDLMDFQLEPARMALGKTRARILIADTVGLGKTLEAGILVTELMARGRGRRILVVTLKSMLTQFQKEFWNRFTIPLVRMDSQGVARVRTRIPRNHNPFDYIEKAIISVDTLKNESEYRVYLEKAYWDIIIIDEAHHVSFKGARTMSLKLAELLGNRSDTLILLTATPHNGKPESFASLMKMLDPTSVADIHDYKPEDIRGLFIRRFRKDVAEQMRGGLPERHVLTCDCRASAAEEAAYGALNSLSFAYLESKKNADQLAGGRMLQSVSLKKALLSSPAACIAEVKHIIKKMALTAGSAAERDRGQLEALALTAAAIDATTFSKYQRMLELLRKEWRWTGKDTKDRLVIFTERLDTLRFLKENLQKDLGLPEDAIETMTGSKPDVEIQEIVEEFGKEKSPMRLLVATDVASEGLNLHYQCHRLVHFDIPWSLMAFQQRNGRIDRYGQTEAPLIAYLLTRYQADVMGGDIRVLELLIEKEKAAWKNIGDPATLMGQFDPEKEELYTADLLLDPARLEAFKAKPVETESDEDFLNSLLASWNDESAVPSEGAAPTLRPAGAERINLYSDYEYLKQGLESLYPKGAFNLDMAENPAQNSLKFSLPDELESHLKQVLPAELRPESDRLELVGDKRTMMAKIWQSKAQEKSWPEADYLWANHPVFAWLGDRLRAKQGRLQAPVILDGQDRRGPGIEGVVYLVSTTHPNRRGQPVYQRLWAVQERDGAWSVIDGELWLKALDPVGREIVNSGRQIDLERLQDMVGQAVQEAEKKGTPDFSEFRRQRNAEMERRFQEMERLRVRRREQLELNYSQSSQPEQIKRARRREEEERLTKTFDSWKEWVRDTMSLEDKPFIQVLAVFVGKGA